MRQFDSTTTKATPTDGPFFPQVNYFPIARHPTTIADWTLGISSKYNSASSAACTGILFVMGVAGRTRSAPINSAVRRAFRCLGCPVSTELLEFEKDERKRTGQLINRPLGLEVLNSGSTSIRGAPFHPLPSRNRTTTAVPFPKANFFRGRWACFPRPSVKPAISIRYVGRGGGVRNCIPHF